MSDNEYDTISISSGPEAIDLDSYESDFSGPETSDDNSESYDSGSDSDSFDIGSDVPESGDESVDSTVSTDSDASGISMYDNMEDVEEFNLLPDIENSEQPVEGLGDEIGNGVLAISVCKIDYEDPEKILQKMKQAWIGMELEKSQFPQRTKSHTESALAFSRLGMQLQRKTRLGMKMINRTFIPLMASTRYANGDEKPEYVQRADKRRKIKMVLGFSNNITKQALLRSGCDWNFMRYGKVRRENTLKKARL